MFTASAFIAATTCSADALREAAHWRRMVAQGGFRGNRSQALAAWKGAMYAASYHRRAEAF